MTYKNGRQPSVIAANKLAEWTKQNLTGKPLSPEHNENAHAPLRGKLRTSEKVKRGKLTGALSGQIRDDRGVTHRFVNLVHFVRTNPHLFKADEIQWRKDGRGHEVCRASKGLANLFGKGKVVPGSWHGWTVVSIHERRFNDGNDLLARNDQENAPHERPPTKTL